MANKHLSGISIDKDKLCKIMDEKGYTPTRLASILGVDRSSVCNWRSGYNVNRKSFKQLLAIFGCEETDLIKDVKVEPEIEHKIADIGFSDISKIRETVKESHNDAKIDKLYEIIDKQNENIAVLCQALTTAVDALNEVSKRDTATLAEITIEAVNDEFRTWKTDIIRFANKVVSVNPKFKNTNAVLSEAYTLLRNQYGLVWEQEQKEFYEVHNRSPITTLELQFWIETTKPTYKNLLVAKLDTLCHKDERKVV